jgi:hypothetical protein
LRNLRTDLGHGLPFVCSSTTTVLGSASRATRLTRTRYLKRGGRSS